MGYPGFKPWLSRATCTATLRRYGWRQTYNAKAKLRYNWQTGKAIHESWQTMHTSWISSVGLYTLNAVDAYAHDSP